MKDFMMAMTGLFALTGAAVQLAVLSGWGVVGGAWLLPTVFAALAAGSFLAIPGVTPVTDQPHAGMHENPPHPCNPACKPTIAQHVAVGALLAVGAVVLVSMAGRQRPATAAARAHAKRQAREEKRHGGAL